MMSSPAHAARMRLSLRLESIFLWSWRACMALLLLLIAAQLQILNGPEIFGRRDCASRWEGELVRLVKDSAGNFACERVDYGYRRKG